MVWLAVATACVENPLVICGNGRACPVGLVCDVAHDACVLPTQLEVCAGHDDGTRCSYPGVATGTCAGGVCFPAVCGGGFVDADEECDDGNRVSGDGCTADCMLEQCGNGRLDVGEACDDGDLRSHDGCDSRCTPERPDWTQLSLAQLGYRFYPAVAHDVIRQRTLAFGGTSAVLADDTWQWHDQTWSLPASNAGPGTRLAMGSAFDAARRELVLFGGLANGTTVSNDTWVYDGRRWELRMLASSPPPRSRGALAYDARRQRIVLFGGLRGTSLDDTWEWDGATWTEMAPATRPRGRTPPAFAYDPSRGTTMMVGGLDPGSLLPNDTWTWDGTTWTELTPVTVPSGTAFALAFDPDRGRMVLLTEVGAAIRWWEWSGLDWVADPTRDLANLDDGSVLFYDHGRARLSLFGLRPGNLLDMLELGPAGWEAAPAPQVPPARDATAMAYDADRGEVLVFGGRDGASAPLGDLWAFTGERWRELPASAPPAPRHAHAMAYDAARGELIVVGGRTTAGRTGETWAWNGASWRLAGALPPHEQLALAYDAGRQRIIAFGGIALGFDGFDHHVAETWQWDGTTWTEIAIGGGPPARSDHAMAYDARRDRIVMFGGANEYQTFNDVWEFDGTAWSRPSANVLPPRRSVHAMAYDANRGRTVLMGGKGAAIDGGLALGDTWEWDGTTWTPIATFVTPSRHAGRVAAYHAGTGRIVAFAGATSDTWFYGYTSETPPEVCGGGHDVDRDGLIGCDDPDCWWRCTAQCPPHASCAPAAPRCGDGTCSQLESCRLCPADCGACAPRCGDLLCDAGESCPGDCGP